MDWGRLITRSFQITLHNRILWIFGILLALTAGSSGNRVNWGLGPGDFRGLGGSSGRSASGLENFGQALLLLFFVGACIVVIWLILSLILRFVSRGALIGLVSELEADKTKPAFKHGLDIGTERFWSLLGIALTVNIPLAVVSGALLITAALPLIVLLAALAGSSGQQTFSQWLGLLLTGALGALILLLAVIALLTLVYLVVRPLYEFFVRVCVIDRRGVIDSIREGYRLVRANIGNTLVLYILIIAIGIGFAIVMIPLVLLLIGIPVGVGWAVGVVFNSAAPGIVAGILIGIPMFLVLLWIAGLYQTYESTLWTEGFLAIRGQGTVPAVVQEPAANI